MLNKTQINEIKEHLDKAQNPLFFFDNDQDGLCSFLLLQRYLERGKGFPVKSIPLEENYFRKINELNPDYLFILDVPDVSQEFFKEIEKINLPVVWIDHHQTDKKKIPEFVNYYNPYLGKKIPSATTYLCYQINKKKQDLWIAILGCISDNFTPKYYKDFKKEFPDLAIDSDEAFDIYYGSQIGKIAQIIGAGLKDRTTNVIKMLYFLIKCKTPYEILEETKENREMHKKFNEIDEKDKKFLNKAKEQIKKSDKLIFFEYGGETSMSSQIANKLKYLFPDKIVFVAYISEAFVNFSARGKRVGKLLEKIFKIGNFENSKGGGHENAVGGQIMKRDLEKFRKIVEEVVEKI